MTQTIDSFRPTRKFFAILLAVALLGCAAAEPARGNDDPFAPGGAAAAQRGDEQARRTGTVVDAPSNITAFRPDEAVGDVAIDAESVNLRQVFDDLGPVARAWYQHVQTLANPFFEGRVPESRGGELAAEYIEFWFRRYGLEPAFAVGGEEVPGGAIEDRSNWISYRQPFNFNYRGRRLRASVQESVVAVNGRPLNEDDDYVVLGISGSAQVTAPLTFVGYGIESGPDGYASFDEETDLTGRIALLLRYEPADEEGNSRWGGRSFSEHAAIAPKIRTLRDRGAAGIILVNPPDMRGSSTSLERLSRSSRFGPTLTIPAVQLSQGAADALLKRADPEGRGLLEWRRLADRGEVRSVDFADQVNVTLGATIEHSGARTDVIADNVGAALRGKGSLANEWIVIGAHYDHVGQGEFGTSPQYQGMLHPGADDNASGTAGLLILARTLSEHYAEAADDEDLRSIIFVAFDAEESGLHGSRHFVNSPTVPLENITAMINMDMIGRLRDNSVSVMGVGTAEGLDDRLRRHFEQSGLTVAVTPGSSGRSDDVNFINNEIPAVHFFTGLHDDYHAPSDKAHTVNPAGARDVLRLIHHVVLDLAAMPDGLVFAEPRRTQTRDRGYAPVRLGIRPGMGQDIERGVQIDSVSPGTSADDGGIVAGDVIIGWNDAPIDDMRGLFEALQQHKPGDVVAITVLREDEEVVLEVTLKASE